MRTKAVLKLQLRMLCGEEIAMGPGKADLLEAIASAGSISAASRHMGMSYRRAWLLVEVMNRCFNEPLVTSSTGGTNGGGASLTAMGEKVLLIYRTMAADAEQVTAAHFKKLQRLVAD